MINFQKVTGKVVLALGNTFKRTAKTELEPSKNNGKFKSDYQPPPKEFIEAQIRREVSNIVDDILEPYNFEESIGLGNIFSYQSAKIKAQTMNLRQILIEAYSGQENWINKFTIKTEKRLAQDSSDYLFLMKGEPDEKGEIDLPNFGKVTPLKTVFFEPFLEGSELELLNQIFELFWNVYQELKKNDKFGQKTIFKKSGFHTLYTVPRGQAEQRDAVQSFENMKRQALEIINGSGGIIDANDSIGLTSGTNSSHDIKSIQSRIDLVYAELARILKIPLTRLLGRSPMGFNSNGDLDLFNYEKTLSRYRQNWVDPFLAQMEIKYEKVEKLDIDNMVKLAQLAVTFNMQDKLIDFEETIQKHWAKF